MRRTLIALCLLTTVTGHGQIKGMKNYPREDIRAGIMAVRIKDKIVMNVLRCEDSACKYHFLFVEATNNHDQHKMDYCIDIEINYSDSANSYRDKYRGIKRDSNCNCKP